jgi:hypothetical protein
MKNGMVEPAPFITIRVSSKKGFYPSPVEFIDINATNLNEALSFVHGECGGDLEITYVKTKKRIDRHFVLTCKKCPTVAKMYDEVFLGETSSLGIYHERWVSGAYQFVLAQ